MRVRPLAPTLALAFAFGVLPILGVPFLGVTAAQAQTTNIVAVVNGDVISRGDVVNRARLFALSAGVADTPEMTQRLTPQVIHQLIDEKLRLQEVQRRKIVVTDKQIAEAVHDVESRNGLAPDALRAKLDADGVSFRTLIDQIRVQIGWTQVLRQLLGDKVNVSDAEVAEQQRLEQARAGKTEYRVSEIFIPVDQPQHAQDALRFAETIISQLRAGAPFPVVAAQFSQSQTALQGGDLGWLQPDQMDPAVAKLVMAMPVNAITNPVPVPGGYSIVTLRGKQVIGQAAPAGGTVLQMRQVFFPFATPLNPAAPTPEQHQVLDKVKALAPTLHSCADVEKAAKDINSPHPVNPGDITLEQVNPPAFKAMLTALPDNKASQPVVSDQGITLMMICSRGPRAPVVETTDDIKQRLIGERAELASRQLLRDLQRRADIDLRQPAQAPAPLPVPVPPAPAASRG